MSERRYLVESMVMNVGSRTQRYAAPKRHRMVTWVASHRVIPKKPLSLSEAEYKKHEAAIVGMIREGKIAVTHPDGLKVDSLPGGVLTHARVGQVTQVEGRDFKYGVESPCAPKPAVVAPVVAPVVPEPAPVVEEPVVVAPVEEVIPEPAPAVEEVSEPAVEEPASEAVTKEETVKRRGRPRRE